VAMLFHRGEISIEKKELLKVICEGNWVLLSDFVEQQRVAQDLSSSTRQRFLLNYLEFGSQSAAYLLLKTDNDFAIRKLDDRYTILMLKLLRDKTPDAEKFALAQLKSPRSDVVLKLAKKRLYAYSGKPLPLTTSPISKLITGKLPLNKVLPLKKKASLPSPPLGSQNRSYIVQDGDSLWKISRRFNIQIDSLKKANHLESDLLKPGTLLKIPQQ
jgi:hypothetical protein